EEKEPDSQSRCTDLVLLTHPRSLLEPDVASAALRVAARNRLFAVTVDDEGDVQFSELRHGAPVRLTSFRVDPELTQSAIPAVAVPHDAPWKGDVEQTIDRSVHARIRCADFDEAGEWLLAATGDGRLFAWNLNDARMECWPRGVSEGKPLM